MRRHLVKSTDSSFFLHKDDIASTLANVKRMLNIDRSIAYSSTLEEAFRCCGWSSKKDDQGNIIEISYSSDHWREEAGAIIIAISKFPEPGSFIIIEDERHEKFWRWNFNGTSYVSKKSLKKEIVDLDSMDSTLDLFIRSAKSLLINGKNTDELFELISQQCVDLVLEVIE